jgi:dienelactone hydrolase
MSEPSLAGTRAGAQGSRRTVPPLAVSMPDGRAPHPGVVIGAEAYGVNPFIRGVQQR